MRSLREERHPSTPPAAGGDPAAAGLPGAAPPAALAGRALAADLLSLRELQASLALEDTDSAVIRVGTNAIVEILAIDCGMAHVDGENGRPPIRFGWLQGRAMTAAEMDSLAGALEQAIAAARDGSAGTCLLAAAPAPAPGAPALPAAARALGFGSVLILGLGSGGQRAGALVLAARDPDGFAGEQAILAEILGAQMSEQCGRVRAAARGIRAGDHPQAIAHEPARPAAAPPAAPGPAPEAGGRSGARLAALEAQAAIAAAVSLSHDADRQVATALRKAIELSGHAAGAIYLVETNDACDDYLRLAHGEGDPDWLELARLPRWRAGEGLPGRVWASGEGLAFESLDDDPAGVGRDVLRRAGYRRMCAEPLRARGRIVGVLEMFADRGAGYGPDDRDLVRAIARQIGMAIHDARLVADLMRHGLDLEWQVDRLGGESRRAVEARLGMEGAMAAAAAEPDAEARAAAVLVRVLEMTGADAACLHEIEAGTGMFHMLSQRRLPGDVIEALYRRPSDDPVLSIVPPAGGVAVIDLASEALVGAGWPRRIGVRHVALVPCVSGGRTRGVLMLGSRYADAFGEGTRDVLSGFAALLALVIECGMAAHAARPDGPAGPDGPDRAEAAPGDRPETASGPGVPGSRGATGPGPVEAALAADPEILIRAQQTASVGRLASGFERDFNNGIGAIMGHASHIRALVPDHNPVHDKAAVIEAQSYRVADLVRRLLTFSRGGTGRRERVDINDLVGETMALLSRTLDPSIVLESRCAPNLPPVEVDPGEIRQVLLNLAVNARDALPDGGRVVFETRAGHLDAGAVASLPGLAPGDYISLVVSDNGSGMPPEVLEHAFDPFYTTKPIRQGSGLGLTVAHEIILDHGGSIALSSAPGIGTAARLYVPVATGPAIGAESAAAAPAAAGGVPSPEPGSGAGRPDAAGGPAAGALPADGPDDATETPPGLRTCPLNAGARGRILVVDDEAVLREMMSEMLKSRGYDVITANDGVEALEIYRREWGRIDLVVCDLVMPRLGGLETFRRITGMNRAARVLLCSGTTQHNQVQQALSEGAVGLLPKPFGMTELAGWIEKGLKG